MASSEAAVTAIAWRARFLGIRRHGPGSILQFGRRGRPFREFGFGRFVESLGEIGHALGPAPERGEMPCGIHNLKMKNIRHNNLSLIKLRQSHLCNLKLY